MLTVEVQGDKELIAKFAAMPGRLKDALFRKMHLITSDLRNYIIQDKLSGQVLNKRTGKLQQSIAEAVTSANSDVIGRVFSSGDVKYAAIHEYGGHTKAHIIEATNGKALAFMMGGKQVFFKRVNHPGSNMPERSFMRSSLKDKKPYIETQIQAAANEAIK